jgi:ribosomal protein S18 acetylase RimI-like enzyme
MSVQTETLTFRRPVPDDLAAAARVLAAEETGVRGRSRWGLDETRDWWSWANLDESWIVEANGEPVAIGLCLDRDPDRAICLAAVDPRCGGRGISTELLARAERRARERGTPRLQAGTIAENEPAVRLFENLGFRPVRHFYRMRIDFERPPETPEWPPGMAVSTFRREDARAFKAALDEAFAEEWGHFQMSFEEWERQRVDDPHADFSLWFIAREGNEVAGVLRAEPMRHGGGFVGALGVRRAWRRRGLGLALLRHVFCEFHRRGLPHATLGVDAENPTGATRLYERAGMYVDREDVVYEKELT